MKARIFYLLLLLLIVLSLPVFSGFGELIAQPDISIIAKKDTMKKLDGDIQALESFINCFSRCYECEYGCEITCPDFCIEGNELPEKYSIDKSFLVQTDIAIELPLRNRFNLIFFNTNKAIQVKKRINDSKLTFGSKFTLKLDSYSNKIEFITEKLDLYYKKYLIDAIFSDKKKQ